MTELKLQTLIDRGACADQVALFRAKFGESVDVTHELCASVASEFDFCWAARNLLPPAAYAEYARVRAPAYAKYKRVTAPAYAKYKRVTAPDYAEYKRVTDAAYAEYERVRDAAYAEYERVRAPAYAEYKRVIAREFARQYIAQGGAQ